MATVIVDKRELLVINPSTREIIIPKSERVFGVYLENGVEHKYFQCPRMVGNNIDLSSCYAFVNYISTSGKHGSILCPDMETTAENTIVFSWELTENVFDENKNATIYFSVHFKKMGEDGKLSETFKTRIAQGKAYETVDSYKSIVSNNVDVIVQLFDKLDKLEEAGVSVEEIPEILDEYFEENPIEKQIKTNETLKVTADGKLAVNTADSVGQDNTLPITSAAVHTEVGNINALLETI